VPSWCLGVLVVEMIMPIPETPSNTLRRSMAQDDGRPINNLPGLYPTEDWVVHYWDVEPRGKLRSRQATIQLPSGYACACRPISIGESGCVHQVRRWGVRCYTRVLEDIGFDPTRYLKQEAELGPGGVDGALLSILLQATHFDLPGYFIIASDQHPLLLFGPDGALKGSHIGWFSYLGALAYLVSEGQVNRRFGRLYAADRALHDRALQYLLQALQSTERP
jgi:hypothetical protein